MHQQPVTGGAGAGFYAPAMGGMFAGTATKNGAPVFSAAAAPTAKMSGSGQMKRKSRVVEQVLDPEFAGQVTPEKLKRLEAEMATIRQQNRMHQQVMAEKWWRLAHAEEALENGEEFYDPDSEEGYLRATAAIQKKAAKQRRARMENRPPTPPTEEEEEEEEEKPKSSKKSKKDRSRSKS